MRQHGKKQPTQRKNRDAGGAGERREESADERRGDDQAARHPGKQRAKELVLTGEIIGAREAWSLGLLNKVVPADQLMVEVRKLADKLTIKAPLAVKAVKEAIEDGYDMALERALAYEGKLFALCFATEDRTEGVNAFLEKRPPTFEGK